MHRCPSLTLLLFLTVTLIALTSSTNGWAEDVPASLSPDWCRPGYACVTKADLAELVRRRINAAIADQCTDDTACRRDLAETERERDECRGLTSALEQDRDRLRADNARLAQQAPSTWSRWLRPALALASGVVASAGVWCAFGEACPFSTTGVLLVGGLVGVGAAFAF